jgi:hypothetical protein
MLMLVSFVAIDVVVPASIDVCSSFVLLMLMFQLHVVDDDDVTPALMLQMMMMLSFY